MENLGMLRAYEEARLGEDGPVVRVWTTSDKLDGYTELMVSLADEFAAIKAEMSRGEAPEGQAERIASVYRRVIEGACGTKSYEAAVRWVSRGEDVPVEHLNALLTPLVLWIEQLIVSAAAPRAAAGALDALQAQQA